MSDDLWKRFLNRYPHADLSKFTHGVDPLDKEEYVRFVGRDGSEFEMFFKGRLNYSMYFSDELKRSGVDTQSQSLITDSCDRFRKRQTVEEPQPVGEVEEIRDLRDTHRLFLCTCQKHLYEYGDQTHLFERDT